MKTFPYLVRWYPVLLSLDSQCSILVEAKYVRVVKATVESEHQTLR